MECIFKIPKKLKNELISIQKDLLTIGARLANPSQSTPHGLSERTESFEMALVKAGLR